MVQKAKYYIPIALLMLISSAIFSQQNKTGSLLNRGNMYTGLTLSFDVSNTENEQQAFVTIQDRKKNEFNININSGYFLKNNWALGAQVSYAGAKRLGTDIDVRNIPEDISMVEESWGIYASTKNYLSLSANHRFYLYNLVILGGRIGNSLTESVSQNILTRTYTQDRLVEMRIVPGIMINVVGGFTVEVGTDIAGFQSSWSHTEVNNQPTTNKSEVSADLTINLLKLSLGFFYYFEVGHKKS